MRRRAVPVVDDAEHGPHWLAEAGTFAHAFATIRAMPEPFTGGIEDVHRLCEQQRAEAQAWCAARGLSYQESRRAAIRQQTTDREDPS